MEVENHHTTMSDSSGDESDGGVRRSDDNFGVGRSYECAFCKRGFTNAQALGGHMNIHRKDKLRAASASKRSNDDDNNNNNSNSPSSGERKFEFEQQQQQLCYYSSSAHVSYHFNYLPTPNPSYYQQVNYHHPNEYYHMVGPRGGPANEDEGVGRKGDSDDDDDNDNDDNDEVDLELRLGRHKYY